LCALSLFIQRQDNYWGESICLTKHAEEIFFTSERFKIVETIENFKHFCFIAPDEIESSFDNWRFFPYVKDKLIQYSQLINKLHISKEHAEKDKKQRKISPFDKILFVGSLLQSANLQTQDIKIRLLLLVSLVEYMLTHNPDFNRFNIEESISKQFKLKTAIIVFQFDKTVDLNVIKSNLSNIYSQRSDIAHGNMSKWKSEDYLQSVTILYQYIYAIISVYLDNNQIVDFMQEN